MQSGSGITHNLKELCFGRPRFHFWISGEVGVMGDILERKMQCSTSKYLSFSLMPTNTVRLRIVGIEDEDTEHGLVCRCTQ